MLKKYWDTLLALAALIAIIAAKIVFPNLKETFLTEAVYFGFLAYLAWRCSKIKVNKEEKPPIQVAKPVGSVQVTKPLKDDSQVDNLNDILEKFPDLAWIVRNKEKIEELANKDTVINELPKKIKPKVLVQANRLSMLAWNYKEVLGLSVPNKARFNAAVIILMAEES